MKTSRVVLGVLAGAAVGALIGVLFAPDKGSNTRKKIMHKGEDIVDDVKDRMGKVKDQVSRTVDRFAEAIHSEVPEDVSGNSRQRHSRTHS